MLVDLLKTAEETYHPEVVRVLRRLHMRALDLQVPPRRGHEGMPGCWFGGRPTLPPEIDWPVYVHNGHAIPMHFLAQFDCASLPKLEEYPMPESGTVMFFYEPHLNMERYAMTYEHVAPDTLPLRTRINLDRYGQRYSVEREEGGRVIYIPDAGGVPLRDPPPRPDIDPEALDRTGPDGDFLDCRFDVEDWNTLYRGTPPMFEGPIPVEAIVVGCFRSLTREESFRFSVKGMEEEQALYERVRKAENALLDEHTKAIERAMFNTDYDYMELNEMFGPISGHYSDYAEPINLLTHQSTEFYSGADGISGFIAKFCISYHDLVAGDLSAAFMAEDSA